MKKCIEWFPMCNYKEECIKVFIENYVMIDLKRITNISKRKKACHKWTRQARHPCAKLG